MRRLVRSYTSKARAKKTDQITPAERQANNLNHEIWMINRKAEASEGGRVFRRGAKTFGAQDRLDGTKPNAGATG